MTAVPAAGTPLQAAMIALFESMHDGLRFSLDDRLRVVSAGGHGLTFFGRTPTQMIGKVILSFLAPPLAEGMAPHLLAALAGQPSSFELPVPGDGRLQLAAAPIADDAGDSNHGSPHRVELFGVWLPAAAEEARAQREQTEKLKLAVRAGSVGLWDWDLHTNKVHYSEEWKQQIGYSDDEIEDDFGEWERRVHPEDLPQEAARVQSYLAERPVESDGYQSGFRFRHKDGSYRHILTHAALQYDEAGEPLHMYGSHIDITQQVQNEAALRENEKRQRELAAELAAERDKLAAVLEMMPVGVWIAGPDGSLISKNSESDRIWHGAAPATKGVADFTQYEAWNPQTGMQLQPEDYPMAQIIRTGETPAPVELRIRRFDGTEGAVLVSAVPIHDPDGGLTGLVGINLDITQRVQTEEALRESEVRYRTLFEENQLVMVVVDTGNGDIVDANPAAAAYFGTTRAQLCAGRLPGILAMTRQEIIAEFERAQAEHRNYVLFRHKRPDGTEREMEVYVSYAKLSERSLAYGIAYDVTQRRQLQAQVLRQERLAAVGQLAAGIAHDFNNIMSVISVYAEMMSESPSLTERERGRMQTIMDQAQRAARLIRQILDFSRQSVLERQVLDLLPLLKEEEKLLRQTLPENIDVRLESAPGEYLVKADPTRIQQLVMNLAVNARDAMPYGGQLHLGLARLELGTHDEVPIAGMEPGPWIRLLVSDTGTGISSSQMIHIFEPFFTTKPPGQGTGLGLAQAHGIVAQHGGSITLASEVGAGTTFTIYLPALATVDTGTNEWGATARLLPAPGHGERVLVVEDEATVRKAIVELLRIWNYHVEEAANGEEALALLAQDEAPDVILSDVVMPRLGGVGLVKALRHVGASTPVILMSGHPMGEDPAELEELRIAAWVEKPPRPELLAQALKGALEAEG
ncbi:MAG: PAS domain S-box protein [Caldilineaceae bacterium]